MPREEDVSSKIRVFGFLGMDADMLNLQAILMGLWDCLFRDRSKDKPALVMEIFF